MCLLLRRASAPHPSAHCGLIDREQVGKWLLLNREPLVLHGGSNEAFKIVDKVLRTRLCAGRGLAREDFTKGLELIVSSWLVIRESNVSLDAVAQAAQIGTRFSFGDVRDQLV